MDLQAAATELQHAALAAVEPAAAVRRHVRREGDVLLVADRRYDLGGYERVFVVGGGKAAVPMAAAIAEILGERLTGKSQKAPLLAVGMNGKAGDLGAIVPRGFSLWKPRREAPGSFTEGVVVTKYEHARGRSIPGVRVIEAAHPVPDENSVRGARAVADLAERATERDLVICLISGGGSALLTLPVPGLTLADLQSLTDALLRCGATINEVNTVRKHCSGIKGGNLARLAAPAQVITLVLSDVVGDPLDVIASGPTVPDTTTVADAREVLARYGISTALPLQETPKPGDAIFDKVQNVIVGSNRLAALAAVDKARELGFDALLLSTYIEGEAREAGRVAAALAKGIRAQGDPLPPPACLVWGGETTVTVRGEGLGGRNQELALAAALALDGWRDVLIMALATDGTDGPTDAAGAVITGETLPRARARGLDARAALEANDSYHFFDALGGLIRTGPTGTNVNDLLFVLVGS